MLEAVNKVKSAGDRPESTTRIVLGGIEAKGLAAFATFGSIASRARSHDRAHG